ncbi:hypothetical protein MSG28_015096 [Choristoneura fumiferana]|uniref:Uncharacterized protein n=1 Tax=Choristoneura fumiferana TaxID=7141 RepID=A0ACC0KYH4_CHOFU|nr:hypothetical protein MSG28_015096 [Choristoneura fumiferana]
MKASWEPCRPADRVLRRPRAGAYLSQRISLTVQRGNAASVLGSMPQEGLLDGDTVGEGTTEMVAVEMKNENHYNNIILF